MAGTLGGGGKRGPIVGINVTPMVDVVLVLLVIMMVSATYIVAQSLKVEPGTAALEVRRSYKTSDGKIAQLTVSIHPEAGFRHSMTMRRVKS